MTALEKVFLKIWDWTTKKEEGVEHSQGTGTKQSREEYLAIAYSHATM